jgi:hypothetical protein
MSRFIGQVIHADDNECVCQPVLLRVASDEMVRLHNDAIGMALNTHPVFLAGGKFQFQLGKAPGSNPHSEVDNG